jgi:hypothetical protein
MYIQHNLHTWLCILNLLTIPKTVTAAGNTVFPRNAVNYKTPTYYWILYCSHLHSAPPPSLSPEHYIINVDKLNILRSFDYSTQSSWTALAFPKHPDSPFYKTFYILIRPCRTQYWALRLQHIWFHEVHPFTKITEQHSFVNIQSAPPKQRGPQNAFNKL